MTNRNLHNAALVRKTDKHNSQEAQAGHRGRDITQIATGNVSYFMP